MGGRPVQPVRLSGGPVNDRWVSLRRSGRAVEQRIRGQTLAAMNPSQPAQLEVRDEAPAPPMRDRGGLSGFRHAHDTEQ